ncbi:hypothetical protein NKDENANG_01397 [Candidatus Entotheonellaceae bacterium PAL068K]
MTEWFPCFEPGTLAVLLIFGTPFVAVVGVIVLKVLKVVTGSPSRGGQQMQAEETRLMQQLYQGLSRMEDRIEALETLLLERDRKEGYK